MIDKQLNARHSNDALSYEELRATWLNQRRTDYVDSILKVVPAGGTVLEIGSGTGYLLLSLAALRPDLTFVGLDPLQNYVDLATQRADENGVADRVTFVTGFAETTGSLAGAPFDAILSNDTLHHVQEQGETCAALAKLARSGAIWLAIEPSIANPYVITRHSIEKGERNFHPRRFSAIAASNGWQEVARRHLFAIPPAIRAPAPWMKRVERTVEGVPGIAGGVALLLVRQ